MRLLSSLDAKDRRLLFWFLGVGIALAVLIGLLVPDGDANDNPLPSTYLAGQHGARAAYETLLRANYPIERWERPLGEVPRDQVHHQRADEGHERDHRIHLPQPALRHLPEQIRGDRADGLGERELARELGVDIRPR